MAKLSPFKRIVKEDFPKNYQDLIDKLGYPVNNAFQSLISAFSRNITFRDNIYCQVKDLDLRVDADGKPSQAISFKSTLATNPIGILTLRAVNNDNSASFPVATPFVSFEAGNGQIIVKNISGLQAGDNYTLTLVCIG